jgi:hypothetical protein
VLQCEGHNSSYGVVMTCCCDNETAGGTMSGEELAFIRQLFEVDNCYCWLPCSGDC